MDEIRDLKWKEVKDEVIALGDKCDKELEWNEKCIPYAWYYKSEFTDLKVIAYPIPVTSDDKLTIANERVQDAKRSLDENLLVLMDEHKLGLMEMDSENFNYVIRHKSQFDGLSEDQIREVKYGCPNDLVTSIDLKRLGGK